MILLDGYHHYFHDLDRQNEDAIGVWAAQIETLCASRSVMIVMAGSVDPIHFYGKRGPGSLPLRISGLRLDASWDAWQEELAAAYEVDSAAVKALCALAEHHAGAALEGVDVVVNLAGENVFGRWTTAKKQRIRESRVHGTRLLSDAIAGLTRSPRVLLAASAIGYYGDRGEEEVTEESTAGDDFLAHVARDWEAATASATKAGIRVHNLRFGVVLTPKRGGLAKMLPAFRVGLGGPVGSGNQYFSWIALDDAINA